jgi:hypothetical protein
LQDRLAGKPGHAGESGHAGGMARRIAEIYIFRKKYAQSET